ncbi:MAG TPA: succinate dehydrogenase cytochrome b subunit [Bacteroidales bacterium]|nr:succinate dehydrogenase cytochrome b subunit [Bacteroidales bacterium]
MSNFFSSSIGKKFLMSITGLFLILFLIVHLTVNSMIVFDSSGELFNLAAHFMATDPVIGVVEPILAIGLILHFIFASVITWQNQRKRSVNYAGLGRYKKRDASAGSNWPSRNMYILGAVILIFLVIHLINFFWKMRFTGDPLLHEATGLGAGVENAYALVTTKFIEWKWLVAIYVVGAIALGLHLYHGVWSAFQTLGWSNRKWRTIWNVIGVIISLVLAGGFAFIPLYVMIQSMV